MTMCWVVALILPGIIAWDLLACMGTLGSCAAGRRSLRFGARMRRIVPRSDLRNEHEAMSGYAELFVRAAGGGEH